MKRGDREKALLREPGRGIDASAITGR